MPVCRYPLGVGANGGQVHCYADALVMRPVARLDTTLVKINDQPHDMQAKAQMYFVSLLLA